MPEVKAVEVRIRVTGAEEARRQINSVSDAANKLRAELSVPIHERIDVDRSGLGGAGGGGAGVLGGLLGGGAAAGGSILGSLGGVLGGAGWAAIAAGAATLAVEIGAVASGFAAATVGLGAFALLAKPTFSAVSGAVTKLATDTAAYQTAVTAVGKADALKRIKADWAALDPAQKQAVKSIQAFQATWAKLAQSFEGTSLKVFNDGLKLANQLLPAIKPLAQAAGNAIDGLLQRFLKFTQSSGFQDWLRHFTSLVGPAITALGVGIGHVTSAIATLFSRFSAKDVTRGITLAFDAVVIAIRFTINAIGWLMTAFDALVHAGGNVAHAIGNFNHAIDSARHAVADGAAFIIRGFGQIISAVGRMASGVSHAIGTAIGAVARFASSVGHDVGVAVSWFAGLPGRILRAVGNLGGLLVSAGRAIISGLISGIQSMLGSLGGILGGIGGFIASHKGPLDVDRMLLYPHGQAIMQGLMAGISSQVPVLGGQLAGVTSRIGGYGPRGYGPGGPTYHIHVNTLVASRDTGRLVVEAIKQFEAGSGHGWRK